MGTLVISTNMSLDGVVEDPDGAEGSPAGGWFRESGGADLDEWATLVAAEAVRAEALLLGRRSDGWFASRWTDRTGEWADRLNGMPKYVVSSTLTAGRWGNSTVLSGSLTEEVATLKRELDGEILIYASRRLGQALLEHDLVDELRLFVFPVVLGAGARLLGETSGRTPLHLLESRAVGDGLAFLRYGRAA
jgi:dihydrofolate reductase